MSSPAVNNHLRLKAGEVLELPRRRPHVTWAETLFLWGCIIVLLRLGQVVYATEHVCRG